MADHPVVGGEDVEEAETGRDTKRRHAGAARSAQ